MQLKKILIANRGEIARRIIRTLRKMGIQSVAIYSEADKELPYVQEADEAYCIGEAPVAKSYLNIEKIITLAKELNVDGIHPGYGLLSENPAFASACEREGICFIGPNSKVIADMGDKILARKQMDMANVPIVPGYHGEIADLEEALSIAEKLGYPVMLKASAGGGGIGMHICRGKEDLEKAFSSAKGRAKAYFGNDQMFLEKYIEEPHHIEVQILADTHGTVLHLFERECSIQRRHQKVIEESPSPFLTPELRKTICDTAVRAAQAVDYVGAGTVEFIVDRSGQFYFLEMNTRIQVEHPVTEMITGIDLIEWQVRIAQGEKLPFTQADIASNGHAIEFRIYAEDPVSFLPSPGKVSAYIPPQGEHIRVDDSITSGNQVTPFYDPMIAKLIIWGQDRKDAINRAEEALQQYRIEGIKHNIPLHQKIVTHRSFLDGNYNTQFLQQLN